MNRLVVVLAGLLLGLGAAVMAEEAAVVSADELVQRAKTRITEIDVERLEALREKGAVLVDVREPDEVVEGTIPGAEAVPRGMLEFRIARLAGPEQPVVVFCRSGNRGALAALTLKEMGYREVYSLEGGYRAWRQASED